MKLSNMERVLCQSTLYAWILKCNSGGIRSRTELFYFENESPKKLFDSDFVDIRIKSLPNLFGKYRAAEKSWTKDKNIHFLPKTEDKSICTLCPKKSECNDTLDIPGN